MIPLKQAPLRFQALDMQDVIVAESAEARIRQLLADVPGIIHAAVDPDTNLLVVRVGDAEGADDLGIDLFRPAPLLGDLLGLLAHGDAFLPGLEVALAGLVAPLIAGFRAAIQAGHCQILARADAPSAPLRPIPADVVLTYRVIDWQRGIARAPGDHYLYAIVVAAAAYEGGAVGPDQTEGSDPVQDATVAAAPALAFDEAEVARACDALSRKPAVRRQVVFFLTKYPDKFPNGSGQKKRQEGFVGRTTRTTYNEARKVYERLQGLPKGDRIEILRRLQP